MPPLRSGSVFAVRSGVRELAPWTEWPFRRNQNLQSENQIPEPEFGKYRIILYDGNPAGP